MRTATKRFRASLAVGVAMLGLAACSSVEDLDADPQTLGGDSSSCASPYLEVAPQDVRRSQELAVRGTDMWDGCPESAGMASDGTRTGGGLSDPSTSIAIELVTADGEPELLATVDADEEGGFEAIVTIPDDAPVGPAEIRVDVRWAEPAEVRVVD